MADVTLIFEEQPISLALTTATLINLVLDGGATYTAGTGISIAGAVITNTAPNVVQTLSIAGQDLTLSNGGGTVAIPGGASDALGTGFTSGGGSGAIPAETDAGLTEDSYLRFNWSAGGQALLLNDEEGQVEMTSKDNQTNFALNNFGVSFSTVGDMSFLAPLANFSGAVRIGQFTSAAAPNNCIFYSTTLSKLAYKDPGGTVNPLY